MRALFYAREAWWRTVEWRFVVAMAVKRKTCSSQSQTPTLVLSTLTHHVLFGSADVWDDSKCVMVEFNCLWCPDWLEVMLMHHEIDQRFQNEANAALKPSTKTRNSQKKSLTSSLIG